MKINKMNKESLEPINGTTTTKTQPRSFSIERGSSTLHHHPNEETYHHPHTHNPIDDDPHWQHHQHSSNSSSSNSSSIIRYRNQLNNGSRVLTCAATLAAACSMGPTVAAATSSSSSSSSSPPPSVARTAFVRNEQPSHHCPTTTTQTVLSLLRGGGGGGERGGGGGENDDLRNHKHKPNNNKHNKSKHNTSDKQSKRNHHDITKSILRETNYYSILGLSSSSSSTLTQAQITKAYRRRCVLTHPDKTPDGDRTAFDKVAEAYDVLGDEDKRSRYDRFGKDGVHNPMAGMSGMGGSGMGDLQDQILRSFFGQHSPFSSSSPFHSSPFASSSRQQQRRTTKPRNHNVQHTLKVSLQDLYNGSTFPLHLSRSQRTIDVTIPRGTVSGRTIRLSGEIDHIADATPGDLLLTVQQVPHGVFTRKGHDLAMECVISFKESVCGFRRDLEHLDGRVVRFCGPEEEMVDVVVTHKGSGSSSGSTTGTGDGNGARRRVPIVISTGDIHVLKGEGMPKRGSTHAASSMEDDIRHKDEDEETYLQRRCQRYGDLYVQYKVELPQQMDVKNLSDEERRHLGALLDKLEGKSSYLDDDSAIAGTTTATTTTATTTNNNNRRSSSSSSSSTKSDAEPETDQQRSNDDLRSLTPASASDFGQASGTIDPNDELHDGEEHLHDNDDDDEAWEGFHRATAGRRRTGQTRFFSNLGGSTSFSGAFGGAGFGGDDDGEVQCQQM